MENVRHEPLESHVLNTCNALGAGEVLFSAVSAFLPFAGVVDKELGHLPERSPLLPEVHDKAGTACLRAPDALFDAVNQIRPTRADVGAENVGTVALVVHAHRQIGLGSMDFTGIAEHIGRHASDGRQEHVQIHPCNQLREHAAGLLEKDAPEFALFDLEPVSDPRQIPNRLEGDLGDATLAVVSKQFTVCRQATFLDGPNQLRHVEVRLGDRNAGTDVVARLEGVAEDVADDGPEGINGDDLLRVEPLRVRAEEMPRRRIGKVRRVLWIEDSRRHGKRPVHGVRT